MAQKEKTQTIFVYLTIALLFFIAGIITTRFIEKLSKDDSGSKPSVLGEIIKTIQNPEEKPKEFEAAIQSSLNTAKDTVTQKIIEVERTVLEKMQNEVTNMTQSQIKTVQYRICSEWGVISITPSP
jgi:hypothetical protein